LCECHGKEKGEDCKACDDKDKDSAYFGDENEDCRCHDKGKHFNKDDKCEDCKGVVNEHGDCIECPKDSEWKDGHCICHDEDDEEKKENNKYARFTAPSKHECVPCPNGDTSKHGVCSSEDCPEGLKKNDDGKCVCKDEKESKKSGENKCHCDGYKDENGCHECPPQSKWDPVSE